MTRIIDSIFPIQANNNYLGHKFALIGFALITAVMLVRSLIHIFKYDGGAQSIATIPIDTYSEAAAATIVAMFAFWGVAQLLLGLLYVVVLIRYRALLPLMILSLIAEWGIRLLVANYKTVETVGQAPGGIAAYLLPPVLLVLFYFSLPRTNV